MANDVTNIVLITIVPLVFAIFIHTVAWGIDGISITNPMPIIPVYKNAQSYWILLILAFYTVIAYLIGKYKDIKAKPVKKNKTIVTSQSTTVLTWVVGLICMLSIYAFAF